MSRKTEQIAAPLYGRIRDALHALILDGTYPSGTRLPTEQSLCDSFGASRITIRQALERLRQEGLVRKVHGQGTFVCAPRVAQTVSTLQSFSEAMTPLGHQVANRVESMQFVIAGRSLAQRLQLAASARIAEIRRVRLLDGAAVSLETTYAAETAGTQLMQADLAGCDIFHVLERNCGIRIGHADVAIRSVAADVAVADALGIVPESPVLCIERHVFDRDGQPVLFEYLNFRGDAFQYQMRINRPGRPRARGRR